MFLPVRLGPAWVVGKEVGAWNEVPLVQTAGWIGSGVGPLTSCTPLGR